MQLTRLQVVSYVSVVIVARQVSKTDDEKAVVQRSQSSHCGGGGMTGGVHVSSRETNHHLAKSTTETAEPETNMSLLDEPSHEPHIPST